MVIDSRIAGLGDAWMRLMALYSLAAMRPGHRHTLLVAPALVPLARKVFSDRFDIESEGRGQVIYTHLGLRSTVPRIVRGERFVYPFFWLLRTQRPRSTVKDHINDLAIRTTTMTGRLLIPRAGSVDDYQGYMELQALPPFRDVKPESFVQQSIQDFSRLSERLQTGFESPRLSGVLVFPSGSAHQVMPPKWAALHLGEARFAFHAKDLYAQEFERQQLEVVRFGGPEEMLEIGRGARRVLVTDSFPSHVWQLMGDSVVVLLTQQPRSRVVHPGFPNERIIASLATCCPCRNRDRGHHGYCDAGHEYCVTWKNDGYAAALSRQLA